MKNTIDLNSFDMVAESNKGESLALNFKGSPTGITLNVLGDFADKVKAHQQALTFDYARKQKMAEKRGTEADLLIQLLENSDEQAIKNACVRVTGWTGLNDQFNPENLNRLFAKNPQWITEVINFSAEMGK